MSTKPTKLWGYHPPESGYDPNQRSEKNMVDQEMRLLRSASCKEWLYLAWLIHVGPTEEVGKSMENPNIW